MDAQRICNILDEHAKPIAQGHCLELEVIGVPIDEFAAWFLHSGTFSVRLECPQKSGKLRVRVESLVRRLRAIFFKYVNSNNLAKQLI